MSDFPPPSPLPGAPGKPWLTLTLAGLFVLGGAGVFFWKPAKALLRDTMASHYASRAGEHVAAGRYEEARSALARAGFWRPDHPALLRTSADFLMAVKGPPHSILHYLQLLDQDGQAREADLLLMARLLAETQSLAAAEAVLARLSPAMKESPDGLEVLSTLQRLRGEKTLADQTLRRALGLKQGDRAARLRLALLDVEEPFQEMRARGRRQLWELAQGSDEHARAAIHRLAQEADLLPTEADRLMETVRQQADVPEPLRLEVLTGLLRARPERRDEVLAQETQRMRSLPADQLKPCLLWLLQQGQAASLLSLHPREYFIRSSDLIDPYLQALAAQGRWQEMEDLLARPAGLPVSMGYLSFWRARATLEIDHEPSRARQHLLSVWEAAGHGRHAPLARAAAALAEHAGLWDLAITIYQGLAEHQPGERVAMLEKILNAARQAGDDQALLQAADQLRREHPEETRHQWLHIYLRLICGREMELAIRELTALQSPTQDEARLCQALAAWRMARPADLRQSLDAMRAPEALPAWQRATHAGLLALDGRTADAFRLAEKLSPALLLPEERRLLSQAR